MMSREIHTQNSFQERPVMLHFTHGTSIIRFMI